MSYKLSIYAFPDNVPSWYVNSTMALSSTGKVLDFDYEKAYNVKIRYNFKHYAKEIVFKDKQEATMFLLRWS